MYHSFGRRRNFSPLPRLSCRDVLSLSLSTFLTCVYHLLHFSRIRNAKQQQQQQFVPRIHTKTDTTKMWPHITCVAALTPLTNISRPRCAIFARCTHKVELTRSPLTRSSAPQNVRIPRARTHTHKHTHSQHFLLFLCCRHERGPSRNVFCLCPGPTACSPFRLDAQFPGRRRRRRRRLYELK